MAFEVARREDVAALEFVDQACICGGRLLGHWLSQVLLNHLVLARGLQGARGEHDFIGLIEKVLEGQCCVQ